MSDNEPCIDSHYTELAAAFVRGRQMQGDDVGLPQDLLDRELAHLSESELLTIYSMGDAAELKLKKFKRKSPLARVAKVLGLLRSIGPAEILDVGSGRGTFLWPLLDEFTQLPVTAIDFDSNRSRDLEAIEFGGIERLDAHCMDLTMLDFEDDAFDVVTTLEVLEHIPNFATAIEQAVRVARRFVIASVPSKSDDNPEHIHLLTKEILGDTFLRAGCRRVSFDSVLNHLVLVATVGEGAE